MKANSALEIVLDRLFDYAGMFPPSSLTFDAALDQALDHQTELARPNLIAADLVMVVKDLPKLRSALNERTLLSPRFSVALLGSILDSAGFTATHLDEWRTITAFVREERMKTPSITPVTFELKCNKPSGIQRSQLDQLRAIGVPQVLICIEPDLSTAQWKTAFDQTLQALTVLRDAGIQGALKVRCSGDQMIPPDTLAEAIILTAQRGIQLKATAGLHHPIVEKEKYGNTYGFLNLACAVWLSRFSLAGVKSATIKNCLVNADPAAFQFSDGIRYADLFIPLEELKKLKQRFRFSIGSCSIEEPELDLARLYSAT